MPRKSSGPVEGCAARRSSSVGRPVPVPLVATVGGTHAADRLCELVQGAPADQRGRFIWLLGFCTLRVLVGSRWCGVRVVLHATRIQKMDGKENRQFGSVARPLVSPVAAVRRPSAAGSLCDLPQGAPADEHGRLVGFLRLLGAVRLTHPSPLSTSPAACNSERSFIRSASARAASTPNSLHTGRLSSANDCGCSSASHTCAPTPFSPK